MICPSIIFLLITLPQAHNFPLDAIKPRCQHTLAGHEDSVKWVRFYDDQTLITSGHGSPIRIWNVVTGEITRKLDVPEARATGRHGSIPRIGRGFDVASSRDNLVEMPMEKTNRVRLWKCRTAEPSRILGEYKFIDGISFCERGAALAIACYTVADGAHVEIRDLSSDAVTWNFKLDPANRIEFMICDPAGDVLAIVSKDDIQLWDLSAKEFRCHISRPSETTNDAPAGSFGDYSNYFCSVAFTPDGASIAAAGRDGHVRVFDAATGALKHEVTAGSGTVFSIAVHPTGGFLAAGSSDGIVRFFALPELKRVATLKAHGRSVLGIAFSPDGRRMATGSHDKTAKVWELAPRP